ncbi:ribosomal protein L15 [Aciduliprofundum sp. MAR08-339]|uniref:uL15m family ribosomal protein n=1 Tax=Aciduliprofundum sp. (strain MAR08-339) TaxID=673860 RepID=UPI0002A48CFB|nr:ribosomal protein L15 [Aciduliprofundum sp. MAR08-339]
MARKKSRKMRGSNTYGHGRKGRRGAGRKGGRGYAGLGKHHWSFALKHPEFLWGNHGFTSHHPKEEIETINIGVLNENLDALVKQGIAKLNEDVYEVDLSALGIKKLLGSGKVTKKIRVKVKYASSNAVEKIEDVGGEVIYE